MKKYISIHSYQIYCIYIYNIYTLYTHIYIDTHKQYIDLQIPVEDSLFKISRARRSAAGTLRRIKGTEICAACGW